MNNALMLRSIGRPPAVSQSTNSLCILMGPQYVSTLGLVVGDGDAAAPS
jgi:hypothetical protein